MIFKKVGLGLFITLILYNVLFVFSVVFALRFGVAFFSYFSLGEFKFSWVDAFVASAKNGGAVGVVLGAGIWIMSKIESLKNHK